MKHDDDRLRTTVRHTEERRQRAVYGTALPLTPPNIRTFLEPGTPAPSKRHAPHPTMKVITEEQLNTGHGFTTIPLLEKSWPANTSTFERKESTMVGTTRKTRTPAERVADLEAQLAAAKERQFAKDRKVIDDNSETVAKLEAQIAERKAKIDKLNAEIDEAVDNIEAAGGEVEARPAQDMLPDGDED